MVRGLQHETWRTVELLALGGPPSGPGPRVSIVTRHGWSALEATGELGWPVTPALRDLVRSSPSALVVDLREVTYLDHNALAVLVQAHHARSPLGGAVRLVAPPSSTRTLLRLPRSLDLLPVYTSLDEAVA